VTGVARLSHAIPDGPKITSPANGARIDRSEVVARWNAVRSPRRIVIKGYRVIVTREDPLRVFSADLPASATSVTIPPEFLEPGTEYKLEVQAIERSGNQTLTEVAFRVRP
jgi:Fibronectin type III domain